MWLYQEPIYFRIFYKMTSAIKRGALIVFEGCDRSGKTTQVTRLVERLNSVNRSVSSKTGFMYCAFVICTLCRPAVMRRFPDRTTSIGSLINSYLGCKSELEDHVVHLLFSANRSVLVTNWFPVLYTCTPPTGGSSRRI